MDWRVLLVLSFFAVCHPAFADSCDNYKSSAEVLAGMSSDDPVAQLAAKTCGLQSSDPFVRGTVLYQVLQGISTMSFDLEPQPKDTVGAQVITQMTQFTVIQVTWDKDARSFQGILATSPLSAVHGQLLGERMGLGFTRVPVLPKGGTSQSTETSCSANLTLSQDGTELTGLLRCTGILPLFVLSLGLD